MEPAIQLWAVIQLGAVGLSHIVKPRAWAVAFMALRRGGEASAFAIALPTLGMGGLIVAFHNVWSGIPVLLTLYGWALVVKAVVYLVAPQVGVRALARISEDRAKMFIAPGVFMLVLAALLAYHLAAGVGLR